MRIRRIVVGFHSLAVCEERDKETEANQVFSTLWKIILKFGVVAFLGTEVSSLKLMSCI
ncbi:hypothetical protein PanWU01x14_011670 [Parasponia andersonii]|uniref:Uncharacterized protein n=1 Tax=Parasponia andersonii TaxID=3476 RepID=A0A2P5E1L7_PARAD|nr:hypothetical protein PanWU01x14_011670 [Parasponia andersonii]